MTNHTTAAFARNIVAQTYAGHELLIHRGAPGQVFTSVNDRPETYAVWGIGQEAGLARYLRTLGVDPTIIRTVTGG